MSVKNVLGDSNAQRASHPHVRRPAAARQQSAGGDRERCAVRQNLNPRPATFVRNYGGHGPRKHCVPAGKRRIDGAVLEKVSVPVSFARPLPPVTSRRFCGKLREILYPRGAPTGESVAASHCRDVVPAPGSIAMRVFEILCVFGGFRAPRHAVVSATCIS